MEIFGRNEADIVVKIGMKEGFRTLQGQLQDVECVLNPLMLQNLNALIALMSFCYGKKLRDPCEVCRNGGAPFGGCFRKWTGPCANTRIRELDSNSV
jgi:hypothetical protein